MEIRNLSESSATYNLLKKGLDAASERSKVIANNIANINTKGYKRYYVSFEDQLKDSKEQLELATTKNRHLQGSQSTGDIQVKQDTTTSIREDGNNVDIDNEMANQSANQLMYNTLISQINSRIALERYVIKEGKG